jgi:hypothetical protein
MFSRPAAVAGEAVDKGKRQLGQRAHVEIDHLQLFVVIERAGGSHQAEACVVDHELRLNALCRQRIADHARDSRFQQVGRDDNRSRRTGRGNFVSQPAQQVFPSRTSTNSCRSRANTRASSAPIPAEAPVITATGRKLLIANRDPHAIGRRSERPIEVVRV